MKEIAAREMGLATKMTSPRRLPPTDSDTRFGDRGSCEFVDEANVGIHDVFRNITNRVQLDAVPTSFPLKY